ncbi:MAG TPA: HEAT repeat domain-containing protein [Terriglobales bacterium]|nr:HEAT repeat domain-containing protein [Terriglobales bacterium]
MGYPIRAPKIELPPCVCGGFLPNDPAAPELATKALADEKPDVQAAAADALGQMNARSAAPKLGDIILGGEKDAGVVLSCARAMVALGDNRGYGVYYAVLTGERKTGGSLLDEQKSDPKKMAQFRFEQGIGFVPFAGIGYGGFKMLTKDDVSPVRAAAARVLSKDHDPRSEAALVKAASDKSWIVRIAALESLALRGDPKMAPELVARLDDDKRGGPVYGGGRDHPPQPNQDSAGIEQQASEVIKTNLDEVDVMKPSMKSYQKRFLFALLDGFEMQDMIRKTKTDV